MQEMWQNSHPRQHCPARDAICHRCKRQDYATQFLSKTVAQVTSEMQELTTTDLTDHTDEQWRSQTQAY